jgi:hypothetical protein
VLLFIFTATSYARDQCAALLALSPWAFTNLDMNASARASTVLFEQSPDEHVNANGNLATIGGQPATGNFCALGRGRQGLYVNFCGALSPTIQTVLDLCTALVDSLSTVLSATLRECGNLRPSRAGYLGRGRRYLLTLFSLLSRASSNLGTVFWTRHRLPLRKSRDCGNLRSLLWGVYKLGRGRQCLRDILFFGTNLQPVRQCLNTAPQIRGQRAIVCLLITNES